MRVSKYYYCAVTLILAFFLSATQASSLSTLDVNDLIRKYELEKSDISIKVISLPANKTIYERNADNQMVIASNIKLFTTAAALCKLGPDFKFTTTISYDGIITGTSLLGNLVVWSNGDPNISGRFHNDNPTAVFEQWAEELGKLGVKNITGDIILDNSAFDNDNYIPSWPKEQFTYWYCAPISAISFNDNCVEIAISVNHKSDKIRYAVSPPTKYVTISPDVVLDKKISENQITFYRIPETNNITITGKISSHGIPEREFITVVNPALFFGTVLKETLESNGVAINGRILCADKPYAGKGIIKVSEVQTDLARTISVINKRSQNFYAEQVLKTLAYRDKGKGTFSDGLNIVRSFLFNDVGLKEKSFSIADGCGLSKKSFFSASQIINLLSYMNRHKYYSVFRESLNSEKWPPKNGKSIRAKTGYIENALALSGYVSQRDNDYAFSLIINDFEDLPSGLNRAEQFRNDFIRLLQK